MVIFAFNLFTRRGLKIACHCGGLYGGGGSPLLRSSIYHLLRLAFFTLRRDRSYSHREPSPRNFDGYTRANVTVAAALIEKWYPPGFSRFYEVESRPSPRLSALASLPDLYRIFINFPRMRKVSPFLPFGETLLAQWPRRARPCFHISAGEGGRDVDVELPP